jgi:hypothetical protein
MFPSKCGWVAQLLLPAAELNRLARVFDIVNLQALILSVLGAALALIVIVLAERWWLGWSVKRYVARLRRDREMGVREQPRLMPESLCIVRLYDSGVECTAPNGNVESVEWKDLQKIEIVTTDQGPFLPDVFWVLHGSQAGCVVPHGSDGEKELLDRLQKLPGFRNEAVIEAMSSTENRRFLCWEKTNIV